MLQRFFATTGSELSEAIGDVHPDLESLIAIAWRIAPLAPIHRPKSAEAPTRCVRIPGNYSTTPQATRPPESPVFKVMASGSGAYRDGMLPKLSGSA
jgi:hypothetical protein